jgi:hypothetical protein
VVQSVAIFPCADKAWPPVQTAALPAGQAAPFSPPIGHVEQAEALEAEYAIPHADPHAAEITTRDDDDKK